MVQGSGLIRTRVVGRSTGNEASDAGLYALCTVSVRDNTGLRDQRDWGCKGLGFWGLGPSLGLRV